MKGIVGVIITIVVLASCAPSRHVRPLEKGQKAITGNLGGPLLNFAGAIIPAPLTAVTAGYGLRDGLTVFGGFHTTALSFGVVQAELGVVKEFIKPDTLNRFKPGLSLSHTTNILVDTWEQNFKFWPQLDANLYWNYHMKRSDYFYVGMCNWFELSSKRAHNEDQVNRWVFSPQAGVVFDQPNWSYNIEAKYLAPNYSNQNMVVDYTKPFGQKGALGIYLGISKSFNMRYLVALVVIIGFSSCYRIDALMFNNDNSITEYKLDDYEEDTGFDLDDSYNIPDDKVKVFSVPVGVNQDEIYMIYIGDENTISTDTVIMYCHGNALHMDAYWPRGKLLANAGGSCAMVY